MKKRSISLPVIVLIAVVALVLGSFGTATAAGLTGKQVKKIAAKVVAKKAKGLSVAHATSADTATSAATAATATSLGGVTAAQLKTTQYQFRLPTQAAAASRTYTFPTLPAGNYFATYAIVGTTTSLLCYFQNGAGPYEGLTYGVNAGSYTSLAGSAFLPTSGATHLTCSGGAFAVNGGGTVANVTFMPIDTPISGTSAAARPSAAADGAARP